MNWRDMHLNFECQLKKQTNGEVHTFEHAKIIEGLWLVIKYYGKHVYNTVPGDGREAD